MASCGIRATGASPAKTVPTRVTFQSPRRPVLRRAVRLPDGSAEIRPLRDLVLVRLEENEGKTPGGVVLPEAAKGRPTRGRVVAAGPWLARDRPPVSPPPTLGEEVLLGKHGLGATDLERNADRLVLLRARDVLALVPPPPDPIAGDASGRAAGGGGGAVAPGGAPDALRPVGDRVVARPAEVGEATVGGVILAPSARPRPASAIVVSVGGGESASTRGSRTSEAAAVRGSRAGEAASGGTAGRPVGPLDGVGDPDARETNCEWGPVRPGVRIAYFRHAGEEVDDGRGGKLVVLRKRDVLCVVDEP